MIKRDSWGHSYFIVRGEILGFMKDELLRKHFVKDVFINQERKLGDRRRSDTVVVLTINYADQGLEDVLSYLNVGKLLQHLTRNHKSLGSGGSMVARLKLKGIDGRAPPGVEPAA